MMMSMIPSMVTAVVITLVAAMMSSLTISSVVASIISILMTTVAPVFVVPICIKSAATITRIIIVFYIIRAVS